MEAAVPAKRWRGRVQLLGTRDTSTCDSPSRRDKVREVSQEVRPTAGRPRGAGVKVVHQMLEREEGERYSVLL